MSDDEQKNVLIVQGAEAGQKLLQFLVRRLDLPQALLHRWIRTGQIRINGGRVKPFLHVKIGDMVRLPPFAMNLLNADVKNSILEHEAKITAVDLSDNQHILPLPPLVYEDEHLLVFNKSYGLPVHTGTGHDDSLATRLVGHYKHDVFKPTPAHRIDKDTTGIILIARSYAALSLLQNSFEQRNITKEYMAWVCGIWPHEKPVYLKHHLAPTYLGYDERVRVSSEKKGRESECIVHCLRRENNCSLMHIRLITGRKHQIRVQLAAEGFPVLGDGKYGIEHHLNTGQEMRLHSLRIVLPNNNDFSGLNLQGKNFAILPQWNSWQSVDSLPESLTELEL